MSLFNAPFDSLVRTHGVRDYTSPGPKSTEEKIAPAVQSALQAYGKFAAQDNQRRQAWEQQRYLTSSYLAQTRMNYELGREIHRYYPLDGRESMPEKGYEKDLGFGVKILESDFYNKDGTRKPYPDLVDSLNDRFFETRSKTAPDRHALSRFELRFREGRMRAGMAARAYDSKRQVGKMAMGMNSVVRSFRENVSMVRGFDPATFAESVDALTELRNASVKGYADPVAAQQAYLLSIHDLLAAGVTESHTDRDNMFALQVMGATPLRQSETLNRAISGLPEKDVKMFQSMPKVLNPFKQGDAAPDDVQGYIPWAIRQIDPNQVSNLQARAVKAFNSQTSMARAELDARMKGVLRASTVGSGLSRDSGVREGVKKSIGQMMNIAERVYPESLYPVENRKYKAVGLVADELLSARDFLDDTPTQYLDANLAASVSRVMSKMQSKYPQAFLENLPILEVATNEMKKAVLTEKKFREENPYHVLQRTNKTIRVLEGRLEQGDYVSPQEKMLMQNELREQVKKESTRIQVTPSFLSFADMGLIRDLDKLGDSAGYSSALREIKGKYGDESFFDYILPQISKIEGMSEVGVFASFIRDLQLSDTVSQAIAKNKENLEVVKTLIPKEGPTVGSDQYWANIWDEDRGIFWDGPINTNMEFLNGHIQDVTQATGRNRARYTSGAMKAAKSLALHYLASGMEQEPKDALELSLIHI